MRVYCVCVSDVGGKNEVTDHKRLLSMFMYGADFQIFRVDAVVGLKNLNYHAILGVTSSHNLSVLTHSLTDSAMYIFAQGQFAHYRE